ncbi:MAG: hypothetical protein LBI85_09350 [Spirochaetaceae bacterium]|jgi:hypothetical protein|nr:hypothetical protein [Spirochaetaceae bacterium]
MKLKVIVPVLAVFLACSGCASSAVGGVNREPVALVALRANNDIHWADEEKSVQRDGSFLRDVLGVRLNTVENADYVSYAELFIAEAEAIVFRVMNREGIAALDRDLVLGAAAYQAARVDNRAAARGFVTPPGYRYVSAKDKEFAPALMAGTGAVSLAAVEFNFTKDMASGIGKSGKMRALVSMSLTLSDAASGRAWYSKTLSARSRETIAVTSGGYNGEELFGLFRTTIEELAGEFAALLRGEAARETPERGTFNLNSLLNISAGE